MAFKRLVIDGYGQLELNNVAFRRDGRVEAQCALDATDFASTPAENGMVFAVDKQNKVVRFVNENETLPIALNYTSEHMYDDRANALKDFKLTLEDNAQYFFPRVGYMSTGDSFTTNCIGYDSVAYATEEAFIQALEAIGTTPLYANPSKVGAWEVTATADGAYAKVIKKTTMPDGSLGVQIQVL
ncbi:hypothetical protein [Clostridium sp.]|uniref:hypothetical protein n=1 Tax=Clostridium sp. TaxID=1506 RepID=UPI0025BC30F3|nr:hypothetical protein [Clostridium sp.]